MMSLVWGNGKLGIVKDREVPSRKMSYSSEGEGIGKGRELRNV